MNGRKCSTKFDISGFFSSAMVVSYPNLLTNFHDKTTIRCNNRRLGVRRNPRRHPFSCAQPRPSQGDTIGKLLLI